MEAGENQPLHPFLQRAAYLIIRHQQDGLTDAEQEELLSWLNADPANQLFFERLTTADHLPEQLQQYQQFDAAAGWETFRTKHFPAAIPKKIIRYRWWSAAAAVALLAGVSVYSWQQLKTAPGAAIHTAQTPVQPGSSKAVLTLADGSTIQLDSTGNQVIAQGAASIHQQGGQLRYDIQDHTAAPVLNTLSTPRGGQFRVILPDGTAVWLNAASSISFPTAFSGNSRQVAITGEAYLEVTPGSNQPFQVKVNNTTTIDVLGTSFCINAYNNEAAIKTTLISGAVRINAGNASRVLAPGQQALVSPDGAINLSPADTEEALAWKNGAFYFNNAGIPAVMRQLERWYDVTVVYEGNVPANKFQGEIQRNLPLEDVLEGLKTTGIRFHVEGRKIIVQP